MSTPSLATNTPTSPLLRLWHTPTLTVARFVLRSHIRSGWILGDIVFLWTIYAVFFLEFGGDVAYFYGIANLSLIILAIVSTVVMLQRSLNARMYLPLARLTSRSAYIRGIILATTFLRILSFLCILMLGAGFHRHTPIFGIQGATPLTILPGALGILLDTIIISILTTLLCTPVTTRLIQILFLAWIVIMFYSNDGAATEYLKYSQLPLAPFAAAYNLGKTQAIDGYSLLMLVLAIIYIIGLTFLVQRWFSKRDLILH